MKKKEQSNSYVIINSVGKEVRDEKGLVWIFASNAQEATKQMRQMPRIGKFSYWKVKRIYNGGVRG